MTNAVGFLAVSRTRASKAHGHNHRQVSQPAALSLASEAPDDKTEHNLIGRPSADVKSDPGLFTTLVCTLGVQGLQVIESWAPDHLHPNYGLAFYVLWRKDNKVPPKKHPNSLEDGEGEATKLWKLSHDNFECASERRRGRRLGKVEGV